LRLVEPVGPSFGRGRGLGAPPLHFGEHLREGLSVC
jgi:hypothetical protein